MCTVVCVRALDHFASGQVVVSVYELNCVFLYQQERTESSTWTGMQLVISLHINAEGKY